MERGKSGGGRGGKSKVPHFTQDLFALGPKAQNRVESSDSKRPAPIHGKTSSSLSISDRSRDQGSSSIAPIIPAKKPKVSGVSSILNRGVAGAPVTPQPIGTEPWEIVANEVEPSDLVPQVLRATDANQTDKVVGLLCGALKHVRSQRWKPDHCLVLSLMYIAKIRPSVLAMEPVQQALCSLLKRDATQGLKNKSNPLVPILVTGLLLRAFNDSKKWPDVFLKLYLDDALNERVWVDMEECKGFVDNITTAFNTRQPPKSLLPQDMVGVTTNTGSTLMIGGPGGSGMTSLCSSPSSNQGEDESTEMCREDSGLTVLDVKDEFPVIPRYQHMQENVEAIVTDFIKEHINRRQPAENTTRNFLRLLSATCGLVEVIRMLLDGGAEGLFRVRQIASSKLEMWLQNPKLFKPAQELLICVCYNCITHSPQDIDVMCNILKIRLKTKTLINLYLSGIGEMIRAHPDNLGTLLKHTIYNELSNSRNPNNMPMLSSMFQAAPTEAPVLLAWVFQELLMNREDYLRPLRALLREVVRVLRHDLDMGAFCRELMSEGRETTPVFQNFEFKDRMYTALIDLITLCIFLSISPAVKEAALAKGEKKEASAYQNYQQQVAGIQRDAIRWHHDLVLRMYRPTSAEFVHGIYKVLFMEPAEVYNKIDMWPPEPERATLIHLASEVPLLQNTLMRIFIIGLSKDHPLNPVDALDFADQLVCRAASLSSEGLPMLEADKLRIIDLIFNLCAYRHPETLSLPVGYVPPQLAITNSYWKAWTMLLLLSAHNPSTFGDLAWQKYPTLRALMEMCITNHFVYPPPLCQNPDELRAKELQSLALEKQQIIEFESHLAAVTSKVTITEANSLLLPQVMAMDPVGLMRRPPQTFLSHLRTLNQKYRLGHRLCRSRKPDFLLDIIQRHGTSHSMPWLADLVVNSEGSLSHLPVQCLCEFLLSSTMEKQPKHQQLLNHLRGVLLDPKLDPQAPCEVLEYFLRRLSSTVMSSRTQAIKGLQLVLSSDDEAMDIDSSDREYSWLLRQLPIIPHFAVIRPQVVQALQQACQMENDPGLIAAYINFLSYHTQEESLPQLTDLVVDMAQLIVERSTIMAALVPANTEADSETLDCLMQIFCSFLQKTREPRKEQYTWSESQDEIRVTWSTNVESTMHILVVHAMVILLTYGPGPDKKLFEQLLEAWFPEDREYPKAYLVDTSEEALLIPDWLKLKMIRSRVSRLVEAALTDLEPPQLVLFIQSFGVPVESMSKLLRALDQSVLLDEGAVADAVLDKNYMAQLVGVQHKRGATGGEIFVKELGLYEQKLSGVIVPPTVVTRPVLPIKSLSLSSKEILHLQNVRKTLDEIFLEERDQSFKMAKCKILQRALSLELMHLKSDGPILNAVVEYLSKSRFFPVRENIILASVYSPQLSCPLFRLICANEHVGSKYSAAVTKSLLETFQVFMRNGVFYNSPPGAIAKSFFEAHKGKPTVNTRPAKHNSQTLVETVTLALLGHSPSSHSLVHSGKLIDKLVAMEPELIGSCPDLQMKLLFGRSAATLSCRPYLLTLLTHRASWATLHKVVIRLLSSTQSEFDPTAVLDFLWALTSNPKLWQGREKNTPKHYVPENVLCLPDNQLLSMVGYIVEEASLDEGNQLESRLPQLLQCVQEDMQLVHKIVNHLSDVSAATERDSPKSKMAEEFLLRLYFRLPGLIKYLVKVEIAPFLEKASITEGGNSMLDRMSHLLFTALTATPPSGDWYKRSQEFELSARKMASVHPPLVLRQLPMLASSLRGRVHLDYGVFRQRNHLVLFQQTAGILELLQPYLFLKQHANALHCIFDSYFALFKHHGHAKDVVLLLGKIVNILQAYISTDGPRALQYLQTHALLLRELQSRHPHLGSLCVLMSGVSLQRGVGCEVELEGGPEGTENGPVIVAVAPPPPPQDIDWRPLLAQLEQAEGEDVISTLQNLEHISVRQPSILQWFVEPLCNLLLSPTGPVRSISHTLLARYWRYDPSAAGGGVALRALTRCLDSNQPEVVASALERIPDVVLCVQEHAVPLLQKVFALGMCSSMNALSPLIKAIGLLNLQSGS